MSLLEICKVLLHVGSWSNQDFLEFLLTCTCRDRVSADDIFLKTFEGIDTATDCSLAEYLSDYSSRSKTVDFAGRIAYDDNGVEVFTFGKHKGRSVEEVFRTEPSYFDWIINGDFPNYTKKIVTEIKLRLK